MGPVTIHADDKIRGGSGGTHDDTDNPNLTQAARWPETCLLSRCPKNMTSVATQMSDTARDITNT